jgi:hypothetical protein
MNEFYNNTKHFSDQITLILRDNKSTPTLSYCEGELEEEEIELKPVLEEDRHYTHRLEQFTTSKGDVERESTKQNTDKVVSCNSTATAERSQQQIPFQNSDKSESIDSFEGENYHEYKWKRDSELKCLQGD